MLTELLPWWAGSLWYLAALSLAALVPVAARSIKAYPKDIQRKWWAALVAALVIRWLCPFDLVRVFTGWELMGRAFPGASLPRYGAGWVALLRPWLWLYPDPEVWISAFNGAAGVATVALMSTATAAWRRDASSHRALLWSAWVLALTPLLVKHHRSESALPVATLMWAAGACLWAQWLRTGDRWMAWLAVPALAAAGHTRPSFVLAAPVTLWALSRWLPRQNQRRGWLRGPLIALLWALLPQLLWLGLGGHARAGRGDLPAAASPWFIVQLPLMLVGLNLALWPQAFPAALTLAGLHRAWRDWARPAQRQVIFASSAVGASLLTLGMLDPVVVSLPRLQAPWLLVWSCAVVLLIASSTAKVNVRQGFIAFALTAGLTVPWLFQPENADHERQQLQKVAELLKGQRGDLYWLASGDSGADKVSRAYPSWRFHPPFARVRIQPLASLPAEGRAEGWVWLGVRCAASHRALDAAAPAHFDQAACAAVRRRHDLEVVFEEQLPNHGDVHFPWWPQQKSVPVALYRLRKKP